MPKRKNKLKSTKRRASSHRLHRSHRSNSLLPMGLLALGLIIILGIGSVVIYVLANSGTAAEDAPTAVEQASGNSVDDQVDNAQIHTIGGVTDCQHNPDFAETLGFGQVAIDTSGQRGKGIALFDFAANNTRLPENVYQHETWDDAGDIGSYTLDGRGNLYVAPFPQVDLYENQLGAQNTIHRIDTSSGVLAPFVELSTSPASTSNPFGVVAMTYDCETDSLYTTTLAGSTRAEELGRIVHLNPADGTVLGQVAGVDAYGLIIFNGSNGKRLYFGHARSGEVRSIALDETGAFIGIPQLEFTLADVYQSHALIARRLSIRDDVIKVDGLKFQYNLVPMAESGPRPSFRYKYKAKEDRWDFVEMLRDDF